MIYYTAINPIMDIWLNGTKIIIREGKYPENWLWEFTFGKRHLIISVLKTVKFQVEFNKRSELIIQFEGKRCTWDEFDFTTQPKELLTFLFKDLNWNIIGAEVE